MLQAAGLHTHNDAYGLRHRHGHRHGNHSTLPLQQPPGLSSRDTHTRLWLEPRWASLQVSSWEPHQFRLLVFYGREADATLLKKPEKLLAGLDRGRPPPALGAPRRRGSMPVPYKHQLRRAQAVDELDWPPQASSSGSSDSLGSGEAAPTQKDGIFKVMLVGESGVGKSTLAGTFGGLQGDSAHELENPEDTYERRIMVDKEEVTLVVYDIWEQSPTDEASPKFQRPYFGSGLGGPTTICLSSLLETRVTWPAPGRSHWRVSTLNLIHICNLRGVSPFQVISSP